LETTLFFAALVMAVSVIMDEAIYSDGHSDT
jgi:hypothetical protein